MSGPAGAPQPHEGITDAQVAALSAAEGTGASGRWRARAVLPVIAYGRPWRWQYRQYLAPREDTVLGGSEYGSVREVTVATVLTAHGVTREADLPAPLRGGYSRRRVRARACLEQGRTARLLVVAPGEDGRVVRAALAAAADVTAWQARPGGRPGSMSQQRAAEEARRNAVAAILDQAGLPAHTDPTWYLVSSGGIAWRPAHPLDGTGWEKIPEAPQPGIAAERARRADALKAAARGLL